MRTRYSLSLATALGATLALPAQSDDMTVRLALPVITTGMYMNPYVALFVEKADDTFVRSLSLWHQVNPRRGRRSVEGSAPGDRYLSSLRHWWRASGTLSQLPIDGVSSATRGAGTHEVVFSSGKAPLGDLPAGKYQLVFEVAREIKGPRREGERGASKDSLEEVRIAFDWPAKKETTLTTSGKSEIGAVSLTLKP